ncbi:hypothetical protein BV25DRAFT_1843244 [Artomyces pyxidatus]|uniref:Uncharacterized protein n=1 Tax=Artomyces pyxidatus TaxID=48021 RepID=A0ACB8SH41_9AGAM|nr:hypothetical protein BV25DRAFT_1843244 [Artomyces pyxidatus]
MPPKARIVTRGSAVDAGGKAARSVADDDNSPPRRSARNKSRVANDMTEMDVDAQAQGSPKAAEQDQSSGKKKGVRGEKKGKATTTRKRANTSELPSAVTTKKPKATKKGGKELLQMPVVHPRADEPATTDEPVKTNARKARGAAKRTRSRAKGGDDADLLEVVDPLGDYVDEDDEGDNEGDVSKSNNDGEGSIEDSEMASDYKEDGSPSPSEADKMVEDEEGEVMEVDSVGVPTKQKRKPSAPRKRKGQAAQFALAVPTFVDGSEGDERVRGSKEEVPHATTRKSHKRVASIISSDTDSGEGDSDTPRTLQPTLPPRSKNVAPKPSGGSKQDAKRDEAPAVSRAKTRSKPGGKQKGKAVRDAGAETGTGAGEKAVLSPEPKRDRGSRGPFTTPAHSKPQLSARSSDVGADGSVANSRATSPPTTPALDFAADDSTQEMVQGGDAQAGPMLPKVEEDVKPDLGAALAAALAAGQWPADTNLKPADSTVIVSVGPQEVPVKRVLKQANTKEITRIMATNHFMPADLTYRDELIREALIDAADLLGEVAVSARLCAEKPYAKKMGSLTPTRMSIIRGELRKNAIKVIERDYNFAAYGPPDKLALGIAELTKGPEYEHIFPGSHLPPKRDYDEDAPFCHPAIINAISRSHFGRKAYVRFPAKVYASSIATGSASKEPELPAPLVAFHTVSVYASLLEYQGGIYSPLGFDCNAQGPTTNSWAYDKHMETLVELRRDFPDSYHTLMHYLYMKAAGLLVDDQATDPSGSGIVRGSNPKIKMSTVGSTLKIHCRN